MIENNFIILVYIYKKIIYIFFCFCILIVNLYFGKSVYISFVKILIVLMCSIFVYIDVWLLYIFIVYLFRFVIF